MILWNTLNELTGTEVYEIFLLRQKIFMLEQDCLYQDIDKEDAAALHCRYLSEDGVLRGYLRVLLPSNSSTDLSIGRVAVSKKARGAGIAREMMLSALDKCQSLYPKMPIRIAAQQYLTDFYGSIGFIEIGPAYIEDDIPHQDMIFKP